MAWFEGFERQTRTVAGLPVCFRQSADWASQAHLPVLVLLHGCGDALHKKPRSSERGF